MNRFLTLQLALLAALLIAGSAQATSSLSQCSNTDIPDSSAIDRDECVAWRFTVVEDSMAITFRSPSGLICFDPNTATDGVATGEVEIRYCPSGLKPSTNPENTCITITATPLTGLTGGASAQNSCIRVGPGTYWADVSTSPGGQSAIVYFQAEGE